MALKYFKYRYQKGYGGKKMILNDKKKKKIKSEGDLGSCDSLIF